MPRPGEQLGLGRDLGSVPGRPPRLRRLAGDHQCQACGPGEQRELTQWFLKVSDYSEELLSALESLDRWPDKVRLNKEYIRNYSLLRDIHYILQTLLGRGPHEHP